MNKQKYIKVNGKLINTNHIVLINETERNFDGKHIGIHLSNNYRIDILDTDTELYNKIIDFLTEKTEQSNVLYIHKEITSKTV